MTEREFWRFLNQKSRIQMLAGSIAASDISKDAVGEFISAHALLPKDYDNLSEEEIVNTGNLLFQKNMMQRTKEAVLILLAHQISDAALTILTRFNLNPDKELRAFAKFALEESLMWNE